ncbi:MAG: LysM peptidoglycan-binding domain-containing protein [Bacteroidetes bacterium]|nr:MAG: LysM peptidoglycan-binding domain-containing protein [Bacteroidota bacterium]
MGQGKLTITAYSDNKYSGEGTGSVTVQINPASYSHNHTINYDSTIPQGAPGTTLKFKGIPPEKVSFEIYFDATGAVPNSTKSVKDQIDTFKKICFTYNGSIHEPNYLMISWASLVFKCKLTSMNINYTLFKQDGTPLRAKVDVSFEEALDEDTIAKMANNESPDLTHFIIFKAGDSLPNLCYKYYNDPAYYLQVATYNDIINFRDIAPGTKLFFPPIK